MIKRRTFWIGILVAFVVGFLYGWFSIWATYTALEQAHREREAELEAVRQIIFYSYELHSQRKEIIEWNRQAIKALPKGTKEGE